MLDNCGASRERPRSAAGKLITQPGSKMATSCDVTRSRERRGAIWRRRACAGGAGLSAKGARVCGGERGAGRGRRSACWDRGLRGDRARDGRKCSRAEAVRALGVEREGRAASEVPTPAPGWAASPAVSSRILTSPWRRSQACPHQGSTPTASSVGGCRCGGHDGVPC